MVEHFSLELIFPLDRRLAVSISIHPINKGNNNTGKGRANNDDIVPETN